MKKYLKLILLLGLSLILLTGCLSGLVVPPNDSDQLEIGDGSADENSSEGLVAETGGSVTGKGTLKIYLTDAPGDYQEVNINISKIEGHIAVDGNEEEVGYWEVLKEWAGGYPVDLIKLEDVSILLASLQLEPNKYTQLRIFLNGNASLVLEGEGGSEGPTETVPLEIPSSAQTGIKLNRPFEIIAGMITKLTIDFDAQKSVIQTGNGKYKMKPVISLSSEVYSSGDVPGGVGSVSGSVSYYNSMDLALTAIEGATIELTGGAYSFGNTTNTSADGSFGLPGVPAGHFTLNVYAEGYDDYSEDIEVISGSDTIVHVVFLTEEPGGISGTVVDIDTSSAILGATVTATLAGGSTYYFISSTETDSTGSFLIEQLPVGSYDLAVEAAGYDPGSGTGIVVSTGATTGPIDISLTLSTP